MVQKKKKAGRPRVVEGEPVSVRLTAEDLARADALMASLDGGQVSRGHVLRRALREGLALLEKRRAPRIPS